MTQPNISPPAVPTSHRPLNGAVLSGTSLAAYGVATYYGLAAELAVPVALAVGATLSTIGDWARSELEADPAKRGFKRLGLMVAARIG